MFGLFESASNRFYLVSQDYDLLKSIQFFLGRQKLFYVGDISTIYNYRVNLINKDNCLNIGVTNGQRMELEIDIGFYDEPWRLTASSTPTQKDIDLQKKISFLSDILTTYVQHERSTQEHISNKIKPAVKGLWALKQTLERFGVDARHLIEPEINEKKAIEMEHALLYSDLYDLISVKSLDQEFLSWRGDIIQGIQDLKIKNLYTRKFKQIVLEKLS